MIIESQEKKAIKPHVLCLNVAECSDSDARCIIIGMCTLRAKGQQQSMGIVDKAKFNVIPAIWSEY